MTNVIVVTSSKVKQVNELIKKQTELMRQGIAVMADNYEYPTTYSYTALNEIKPEMITEATKAAREAADRFAADCGSKLGKIKTASHTLRHTHKHTQTHADIDTCTHSDTHRHTHIHTLTDT